MMEYIVGIAVFVLGLVFALVSVRKIKGSFVLPLTASFGLMVAGVGMVVNAFMERNSAASFDGSNLEYVAYWFPLIGFGVAAVVMVAIAIAYYSKQNARENEQAHDHDEDEELKESLGFSRVGS
jgi:mannose/fructose/N-acetylgalactosamine-specific phosphotransferase system component IIC